MKSAIYLITCSQSGKRYVGGSAHIEKRWSDHKSALRLGNHANPRLQSEWNTYGLDCLEFSIIELVTPDLLEERERHWCGQLQPELNLMLPNEQAGRWTHSPGRRGSPLGRIRTARRKRKEA